MLETIANYRKSIGNNQNYHHRKIGKSVTCVRADNSNNSSTPNPIRQFGAYITEAINSPDEKHRIPSQQTSPPGKVLTLIQFMLLLDNITLPISESCLPEEQMISASGKNVLPRPQSHPSGIEQSTLAKVNKNQAPSAVEAGKYPSLIPGAYAAPIFNGNEGVIQVIENDSCMINSEQKKDKLISAITEQVVSNGQLSADDANDFEFSLRSEAAGAPIYIAHLHVTPKKSRIIREAQSAQDERIMGHIKGTCAFEEEIYNSNGESVGKTFLLYAQRAENPFRTIYDNKDGRPSPETQGLAEGLNISADIITLGLKSFIARLIANKLREKHYSDLGDKICAQRFSNLFIADMGTSLNADGQIFKRGSSSGKVKPHELFNALPAQSRAAFYTRNSQTGIRTEVLLELNQLKGSINDNGRVIYLKSTGIDNEFITYHPNAVNQGLLQKKVIVNNDLRWRYADTFDSTGLNVQTREGKKQINLYGDYYELNQNSVGKFEIVIKKESGIRENIPVYMEPLSRNWHLNVHNGHQVFNNEQKEIVSAIKTHKEDGFYYVPRSNNNEPYYGNGKIYHQEKVGDAGHYPWGRYIEINGELVPVRNVEHKGKGILYEIYDIKNPDKKGYAVEWDGDRWLFEKPTSAHISKNVESFLSDYKHIQNIDVSKLSAPDHHGVRWTVDGESYIKVNNEFYKMTLTDEGGIIHISESESLGMKLSFGKNKFENDALLSSATNKDVLTPKAPAHTDQRLNRQGARKIKNTKALEDIISKDIIRTDFKPGDLSPQNSMGIRKDGSGNMYIKVKNGWVSLSKSDTGYSIPVGKEKIRVEFTKNRWSAAETAPGFPGQLNYFPSEQASVTVSCTDGYSTTFDIDPTKTLTKNILEHFDPIDDGLLFDMKKSQSDHKHEFFSINKVTIKTSDSERSVYYPDDKPGGLKNSDVLFDVVPINFKTSKNILIAPNKYKTEMVYTHYPYDLHVMKQGTIKSCGFACITMIAKDLKKVRNIDESVIKHFMSLNKDSTDGAFSLTLSEIMSESGVSNKYLRIEDPAKYIQDKMREDRWTGIVNIDGHFCIITKADTHEFYFRDPYQGILSLEKTDKLKNLSIGKDIIEM
ncbi:cysteine peptidase family C39 domain-containing protein [Erwinia pyrifoliae]|uniref:Cysteine peptidase family C39 domain-containing protein n=1 Tax=Erwinia pyrifoliae TaxID=79967 RepID=A0ABY5X6M5_ERWPY|nr:cysteine peptidase family C39 domain-containing protein [Erwinia pyrifoliae]AUX73882.1 hypothetical protein CPI84_16310 [Erwinia pyrifoliae]MCA8875784.1 hypothetical protein [Erwinia pyrifoliae]UWS33006.1 cysteine peptidase family C39 domain-containing protein [Erwinia pyrifoliae]UXK11853.1 cysteine peptidase family C39 domain-containing protein [Erwinia pyrifoliae]CAX54275.1 uncharacterized protein EpC_05170 [Erwinia pyrifoliae Ep1/96]